MTREAMAPVQPQPPEPSNGRARRVAARVLLGIVVLVLLAIAYGALSGGIRQVARPLTVGQQIETGVQLVAGVLTLLVIVTRFWLRRLGGPIRLAWAITLAMAAGLSALVWGPPMPHIGLIFVVLVLGVAWLLHRALGVGTPEA